MANYNDCVGFFPTKCEVKSLSSSTNSTSTTLENCLITHDCCNYKKNQKKRPPPPNIQHEFNTAKAILQQCSSLSGDNMYDHLSEIIRCILNQRPPNVIDYFEEFSRNLREQKLHYTDSFMEQISDESRAVRTAHRVMESLKFIPNPDSYFETGNDECEDEMDVEENSYKEILPKPRPTEIYTMLRPINLNENVLQLQLFWSLCGFGFKSTEVYQLSFAMIKLIQYPVVQNCRFWGKIYGLKNSYYIVEVDLIKSERERRLEQMREEMQEKILNYHMNKNMNDQNKLFNNNNNNINSEHSNINSLRNSTVNNSSMSNNTNNNNKNSNIDANNDINNYYNSLMIEASLIPGFNWQNHPDELLKVMQTYHTKPLPKPQIEESFDIPPEPIGSGLNRKTYFVICQLTDEWIELPIVTPKQITTSKDIRKYLTGELESEIVSYPIFPGREKHLLRALIARISASTYIAPVTYYRKQTRKEQRILDGELTVNDLEDDPNNEGGGGGNNNDADDSEDDDDDGEEEEEDGDENKLLLRKLRNRDAFIVPNPKYKPIQIEELESMGKWVHTRPEILKQGRIMYFDKEKALQKSKSNYGNDDMNGTAGRLDDYDDDEEEDDDDENNINNIPEEAIGLELFASCEEDTTVDTRPVWSIRYSAKYNKMNRLIIMRSNLWPGSYTFAFEKYCDTMYLGWGLKQLVRNYVQPHIPRIQNEYEITESIKEIRDPTVDMEEEYRLMHLKPEYAYEGEDSDNEEENEN